MRNISTSLISSPKQESGSRERDVSFSFGEVLRAKVAASPIRCEFPDTHGGRVAIRSEAFSQKISDSVFVAGFHAPGARNPLPNPRERVSGGKISQIPL